MDIHFSTHVQVYILSAENTAFAFEHTNVKIRETKIKDFINYVMCAWNWVLSHVSSWNYVKAGYRNQEIYCTCIIGV